MAQADRTTIRASMYVGENDAIVVVGNLGPKVERAVAVNARIVGKSGLVRKQVRLGALKANGIEFRRIAW